MLAAAAHGLEIFFAAVASLGFGGGFGEQEQIGVSLVRGEGGAEFVAHVGEKGALGEAGGLGGPASADEFFGDAAAFLEILQNPHHGDAHHEEGQGAGESDGEECGMSAAGGLGVAGFEIVLLLLIHAQEKFSNRDERFGGPEGEDGLGGGIAGGLGDLVAEDLFKLAEVDLLQHAADGQGIDDL